MNSTPVHETKLQRTFSHCLCFITLYLLSSNPYIQTSTSPPRVPQNTKHGTVRTWVELRLQSYCSVSIKFSNSLSVAFSLPPHLRSLSFLCTAHWRIKPIKQMCVPTVTEIPSLHDQMGRKNNPPGDTAAAAGWILRPASLHNPKRIRSTCTIQW